MSRLGDNGLQLVDWADHKKGSWSRQQPEGICCSFFGVIWQRRKRSENPSTKRDPPRKFRKTRSQMETEIGVERRTSNNWNRSRVLSPGRNPAPGLTTPSGVSKKWAGAAPPRRRANGDWRIRPSLVHSFLNAPLPPFPRTRRNPAKPTLRDQRMYKVSFSSAGAWLGLPTRTRVSTRVSDTNGDFPASVPGTPHQGTRRLTCTHLNRNVSLPFWYRLRDLQM